MPAVGNITVVQVGTDLTVSDEAGTTYTIHGYGLGKGVLQDIDPRIDLAQPIYEQVLRLQLVDAPTKPKLRTRGA